MKQIKYFALILITVVFSSCKNDGSLMKNREADAAKAASLLTEAILYDFESLQNLEHFYAYNQEYLQILTKEKDTTQFKNPFSTNNASQVLKLFKGLKKVYQSEEMVHDKYFNKDNSEYKENVILACELLDMIDTDEKTKLKINEIVKTLDAKKFEALEVSFEITKLFSRVLDNNINSKIEELEKLYNAYSEGVEKIPAGTFATEKLEILVAQPVEGKDLLFEVYKLQIKDKAYQKKQAVEGRFIDIQKGMENLRLLYAEQLKKKKSKKEIDKLTNSITETFGANKP